MNDEYDVIVDEETDEFNPEEEETSNTGAAVAVAAGLVALGTGIGVIGTKIVRKVKEKRAAKAAAAGKQKLTLREKIAFRLLSDDKQTQKQEQEQPKKAE